MGGWGTWTLLCLLAVVYVALSGAVLFKGLHAECLAVEAARTHHRLAAWRLVQVKNAGESADENSRVCHAVLERIMQGAANKAG